MLAPTRGPQRQELARWPAVAGASYVAIILALGGLTPTHMAIGALGCLGLYNTATWHFLRAFLPFVLVAIFYDSMRYFYWQAVAGHIHVREPHDLELSLLGIHAGDATVFTPNEWLLGDRHPMLDGLCGLAYLTFLWQYFGLALYLHIKGSRAAVSWLAWTFFWLSITGFLTYFVYPAAPPWYVTQYGFGPAHLHIAAEQAGARQFDALLGTHFFKAWYGMSIDVYGAIPSLHAAYPFVAACATWFCKSLKPLRLWASVFFVLMCFSAVYLQHHYVVDVVLGVVYASVAMLALRAWGNTRWRLREVTRIASGS